MVEGLDRRRGGRSENGMLKEEITKEEIRKSIWKLKKGKAGGVCEISGELLKAGGEAVIEWLTEIYTI